MAKRLILKNAQDLSFKKNALSISDLYVLPWIISEISRNNNFNIDYVAFQLTMYGTLFTSSWILICCILFLFYYFFPFFLWLITVEHQKERERFEYIVTGGKIFHKQTGDLLDTNSGSKGAKWIFVMSTSMKLYAAEVILRSLSFLVLILFFQEKWPFFGALLEKERSLSPFQLPCRGRCFICWKACGTAWYT